MIRYERPKGGLGMQEMLNPASLIVGMGLGADVALITNGKFSNAIGGLSMGRVSPETARGGFIGLLKDGNEIEIDVDIYIININLGGKGTTKYKNDFVMPQKEAEFRWLKVYQKPVANVSKDAVLDME